MVTMAATSITFEVVIILWIASSLILGTGAQGTSPPAPDYGNDYGSYAPLSSNSSANLFEEFYDYSCPNATTIVKDMVTTFLAEDPSLAGSLQRLHFHDCWVNGCDGSILLASTSSFSAERDGLSNFKIRGIVEIDEIKAALEDQCPLVVSCADILALVAREATYMAGGPWWNVSLGRRDGLVSRATDADSNLPTPVSNWTELAVNFAGKGFTAREMVILNGAHTIGRAHCMTVTPQLYNYTGIDDMTNPALNVTFADELKQKCPKGNTLDTVSMDSTKNQFDELFYQDLLEGKGVLQSDLEMMNDPLGLQVVTESSQAGSTFFDEFAAAMVKMGMIEVLSGAQGEVRRHCQYINQ
ncbi:hypothetical protein R1flu_004379 [Riccia fluitans]|uniref:Peroxidase n=1 Tax=Riccia fluitans TaxID=41844 RepID=A0ABD1YQ43_9MARC